jgi:hypothetical protein
VLLISLTLVSLVGQPVQEMSRNLVSEAARKGVDWLLVNQNMMPVEWAFSSSHKLYRTVADEALAERLLRALRQKNRERELYKLPADLTKSKFLRWKEVEPFVKQLIRDECEGTSDPEMTERLCSHIRKNQDRIIDRLGLSQKIVATFYLKEMDGSFNTMYEQAISDLRKIYGQSTERRRLSYLYAVTHVIFTKSGYYDRYLDREKFRQEEEVIRRALSPEISNKEILAEMLICLKLLRVPADDQIRQLNSVLVKEQNLDGSWGTPPGVEYHGRPWLGLDPRQRIHLTYLCTLALIDFAPEFRGGRNIRCVP